MDHHDLLDWMEVLTSDSTVMYPAVMNEIFTHCHSADSALGKRGSFLRMKITMMCVNVLCCSGYSKIQGTKPQTLGYALNDSPVGKCFPVGQVCLFKIGHPEWSGPKLPCILCLSSLCRHKVIEQVGAAV